MWVHTQGFASESEIFIAANWHDTLWYCDCARCFNSHSASQHLEMGLSWVRVRVGFGLGLAGLGFELGSLGIAIHMCTMQSGTYYIQNPQVIVIIDCIVMSVGSWYILSKSVRHIATLMSVCDMWKTACHMVAWMISLNYQTSKSQFTVCLQSS